MRTSKVLIAAVAFLTLDVTDCSAGPIFYGTHLNAARWEVAVSLEGEDGQFSSFPTSGFVTATQITLAGREEWIANNEFGNNQYFRPTFFVYRQTFDLTGYDPTTAHLQFQWAADDSGRGGDQGTWKPKYSLNGGPLVTGIWPDDFSYHYSPTVDLTGGFVSGLNTLTFYVEGNGVTDGFALRTLSFTAEPAGGTPANPVPAPGGAVLLLSGLGCLGLLARRRRRLA